MFWAYMALGGMATIEIKIRCLRLMQNAPTRSPYPSDPKWDVQSLTRQLRAQRHHVVVGAGWRHAVGCPNQSPGVTDRCGLPRTCHSTTPRT